MTSLRSLTPVALLLAAACATPVAIVHPEHAALAELRTFQIDQQVFREQNIPPMQLDFPGHGRVTVREISLDGYPGNTYVRCRFNYQNRTEKPVVQAWIVLDVLDPEGRVVASQASVAIVPVPIALQRGSNFADELRTQTYGVHQKPGWSWRIRCIAQLEQEDEPLDPPAPEPNGFQSPPMTIKARISPNG